MATRSRCETVLFRQLLADPVGRHIPPWLEQWVDPGEHVIRARLDFGTKIGDNELTRCIPDAKGESYLGVVLSGEAEVLDLSSVKTDSQPPIVAHRPIRSLAPGDVFGEFELLDRTIGRSTAALPHKESFEVVAGRRCFLLLEEGVARAKFLPDDSRSHDKRDVRVVQQGFEVFHAMRREMTAVTEIAFLPLAALQRLAPPPLAAWQQGWGKVAAYRDGVNSYTFSALLDFRATMVSLATNQKRQSEGGRLRYPKSPAFKTLPSIMADAMFDALNRPASGELMYTDLRDDIESDRALRRSAARIGMDPNRLLIATTRASERLVYPLDMHNFLLNQYAFKAENTAEIVKAFGKQKGDNGARTFYCDLANEAIVRFAARFPGYPFKVACVSEPGPSRPVLVLEFRRAAG